MSQNKTKTKQNIRSVVCDLCQQRVSNIHSPESINFAVDSVGLICLYDFFTCCISTRSLTSSDNFKSERYNIILYFSFCNTRVEISIIESYNICRSGKFIHLSESGIRYQANEDEEDILCISWLLSNHIGFSIQRKFDLNLLSPLHLYYTHL